MGNVDGVLMWYSRVAIGRIAIPYQKPEEGMGRFLWDLSPGWGQSPCFRAWAIPLGVSIAYSEGLTQPESVQVQL